MKGANCNKIGGEALNSIMVKGSCSGKNANFFLDTGSHVSIVAHSFVKFIGAEAQITSCDMRLTSFSGNQISTFGKISLPISIAGL